jgi:hypothetical protein
MTIFIRLLEEGTEVYRPVNALEVGESVYRIEDCMPEDEIWEFQSGDIVYCIMKDFEGETRLAAINKTDISRCT